MFSVEAPRPELAGVWHLENSFQEAFGLHESTHSRPPAIYGGPPAPALDRSSIRIPRLASIPTVDGALGNGEYGSLKLPIWLDDRYGGLSLSWVHVGATPFNLYLHFDSLDVGTYFGRRIQLNLDPDGNGGTVPDDSDSATIVPRDGTAGSYGISEGGRLRLSGGLSNWSHDVGGVEFALGVEMRIRLEESMAAGEVFGMQFLHDRIDSSSDSASFPVDAEIDSPDTWARFRIADASSVRADGENPRIRFLHDVPPEIAEGESVLLRFDATDDVDLARVDIYVDDVIRTSEDFPENFNRAAVVSFRPTLPIGSHTAYARATDHRGRIGFSRLERFFVQHDGALPKSLRDTIPSSPPWTRR